MILTLNTSTPQAEIGLYKPTGAQISYFTWEANRDLARDLLTKIKDQLDKNNADFTTLSGVVVFAGPGSFTGLRIGLTVANTIAYGQGVPIISALGEDWKNQGIGRLKNNENDKIVLPHYGAEANITLPKK